LPLGATGAVLSGAGAARGAGGAGAVAALAAAQRLRHPLELARPPQQLAPLLLPLLVRLQEVLRARAARTAGARPAPGRRTGGALRGGLSGALPARAGTVLLVHALLGGYGWGRPSSASCTCHAAAPPEGSRGVCTGRGIGLPAAGL